MCQTRWRKRRTRRERRVRIHFAMLKPGISKKRAKLREVSDISNSLKTDAEGKVPTVHRHVDSLVKSVELMREGQEDNADSDDNGDDERVVDGDTTALRGEVPATTRTTYNMMRRDRRHTIGTNNGVRISLEHASVFSYDG